ncbi:MAG TPA: ribose-5-phosphate isomerase [Mycobacteriales bacterium]|nr:ribose-5-phosphate isomerase [Mycobacteriales bacterium]
MRVYLGSDHAGFDLKAQLVEHLRSLGHEPVDCGPHAYDAEDDYPPYVLLAATRAAGDPDSAGIVLGGSGNGEAIAANKVRGVRCALAFSDDTARLAREHNDANVLSLGARMYDAADAQRFVEIFLSTAFTGESRHVRRLGMLTDYEETGELPPLPSE